MAMTELSEVHQSHAPRLLDIQPKFADRTGNILPRGEHSVNVDISEEGRLILEREMQNIAKARDNQEFVDFQGHDGNIRLGLTALGKSTIDDWSARGLEVTEESVLAAAEAFQEAFRKLDENGSSTAGASIALNRHQLIINSQAVPEWFVKEFENALSSMSDSPLKSAFNNGDTFFVSQPSTSNSKALSRYAEINHSI